MRTIFCGFVVLSLLSLVPMWAGEAPKTGPATEKRFPALKLAKGFKATLFACDPLIEYPSVIAAGPKASQVFVAIDYMTGLGVDIVRRDEIRMIEDTDGDGYADKATVYASGFNSIQGIAYHDGAVYVMHAPYLTVLRDTKGTGKADERRDLLTGLGLKPEDNPPRLHCANGVTVGHDGWLYLSLGDHGCNVLRPEGDRLIFNGGGILRCRFDGSDLHVFATGLRNIYDVALDEDLNVFVRDNENDGGTYMIRVCHSFFGADHGYPYLYDEHPQEALPPLADLGLGSSAGGVCYLETLFPTEYRGNLFFCEWGRSLVRYVPQRKGSGFAPMKEFEFAAGAPDDPYGFKPTDVVVQRDGALMVSDWCDGQRPKRGRGRIYRIVPDWARRIEDGSEKNRLTRVLLDSPSYFDRCEGQRQLDAEQNMEFYLKGGVRSLQAKLHVTWALANSRKFSDPIGALLRIARQDNDPRLRAQAVRAIADLTDPVLVQHRLDAGRGNPKIAMQLTTIPNESDPLVLREITIALGRLRWVNAPVWIGAYLPNPDPALAHAAQQTLRRADNWPAVLRLLDRADADPIRTIALHAVTDQTNEAVVDGLVARLQSEQNPKRRGEYADLLTRVYKKPGPWVYWGYRPAPKPANTVAWERTDAIAKALDAELADPDKDVRVAVLKRMEREKVPVRAEAMVGWLEEETAAGRVAVILAAFRDQPLVKTQAALERVVLQKTHTAANRQSALAILDTTKAGDNGSLLLKLASVLEDGPIAADTLRRLGNQRKAPAESLIIKKLESADAEVRAASIEAAGKLDLRNASPRILELAKDTNDDVRRASFDALRLLKAPGAVPLAVAGLKNGTTQAAALRYLAEFSEPENAAVVLQTAKQNPSAEILPVALGMLARWAQHADKDKESLERALAELQGSSGIVARWHSVGPMPVANAERLIEERSSISKGTRELLPPAHWDPAFGAGVEARVRMAPGKADKNEGYVAVSTVVVPDVIPVQFLASSSGPIKIWLNGKLLHSFKEARTLVPDADRFDGSLAKGVNQFTVLLQQGKGQAELQLRFRRKSSAAAHEQLIQTALVKTGNAERGKKLFHDVAKSQCMKCHRIGPEGERIGPELTGVGNRFARIYLIESILEPSRAIAPSFETLQVQLTDGRVLSGVRIAETPEALTIGDTKGDKHVIKRSAIEEVRTSPISTMPEGLERGLTPDEFVDLIAFLTSQK